MNCSSCQRAQAEPAAGTDAGREVSQGRTHCQEGQPRGTSAPTSPLTHLGADTEVMLGASLAGFLGEMSAAHKVPYHAGSYLGTPAGPWAPFFPASDEFKFRPPPPAVWLFHLPCAAWRNKALPWRPSSPQRRCANRASIPPISPLVMWEPARTMGTSRRSPAKSRNARS